MKLPDKALEALVRIIEYEDKQAAKFKEQGFEGVTGWELLDIPVDWASVKPLVMSGIVVKKAKKWYALADREKARALVASIVSEKIEEAAQPQPPATIKPEEIHIPEDLFSIIVGYDGIKDLFIRMIKADKPFHTLLIGPPSSAKTLFLLELSRLPGAFYCLGGSTTKVGLIDQLFEFQPRFLLVDELEKMNKIDYAALLSLMETGIVKETKHDKTREIKLSTSVISACNSTKKLPPELLSRFHYKLKLSEYSPAEFERIAVATLVTREKIPEELAQYIAKKVGGGDIREVIGIARAATSKEDVDKLIALKKQYGW